MMRDKLVRDLVRQVYEMCPQDKRMTWREMRHVFRRNQAMSEQIIGADLLALAVQPGAAPDSGTPN